MEHNNHLSYIPLENAIKRGEVFTSKLFDYSPFIC